MKDRLAGEGLVDPRELQPHPDNWRVHRDDQRESMEAALDELGNLDRLIVNRRNNRIIDGHLRHQLALERGDATVPVQWVDLDTDEEESAALALFDSLGRMAVEDPAKLRLNIERADLSWLPSSGVGHLLATLAPPAPLPTAPPPDWPTREPTEHPVGVMRFMVSERQREQITAALRLADPQDDPDNDNQNGNALATIVDQWLQQNQSD